MNSIILIGPYLSGKSTMRRLLADKLGLEQCSLNLFEDPALCHRYYKEAGYDDAEAQHILNSSGYEGLYRHLKPYDAYAVERCLLEHANHVIELGATQSIYEDYSLSSRVRAAFADHRNVVLLMPSRDREESYQLLRERYWAVNDIDLNEHFIKHHSNHDLATRTVYTEGKTPEQTRNQILQLVNPNGPPESHIVLIGPRCAGKSTIARLLAERLMLQHVSLDSEESKYYRNIGYDEKMADQVREQLGFRGFYCYRQPFVAQVVERVLAENRPAIVDFGADHSVYIDNDLFARIRQIMAPVKNVILLLPLPDLNESVRILKERPRITIHGIDANKYVIDHSSNYELAKVVAFTKRKMPEETRDEVIQFTRS